MHVYGTPVTQSDLVPLDLYSSQQITSGNMPPNNRHM